MKYKTRIYFPSGSYIDTELEGTKRIGRYFTVAELANKAASDNIKLELWPESIVFIGMLDELREQLGPITVNSGYRTKTYNKKIGGDPRSAHLHCCAIDFPVFILDRSYVASKWKELCKAHAVKGAINYYKTYYHIEAYSDKWYGQQSAFIIRNYLNKK